MSSILLTTILVLAACSSPNPAPEAPAPAAPAPTPSAPADPANSALSGKPLACTMGEGGTEIQLRIAMPEGQFTFDANREQCTIFAGHQADTTDFLLHFMLVSTSDAGSEQLLNIEPDGVRQFLLKSIVQEGQSIAEGNLTLLGKPALFYRLSGSVFGAQREVTAARIVVHEHNLVAAAVHARSDTKAHERAIAIFSNLTAKPSP